MTGYIKVKMGCKTNGFGIDLPDGACPGKSNEDKDKDENFMKSVVILVIVVITMIIVTIFAVAGYHAFLQHPELPISDRVLRGVVATMLAPFYLVYTYLKIYIFGRA